MLNTALGLNAAVPNASTSAPYDHEISSVRVLGLFCNATNAPSHHAWPRVRLRACVSWVAPPGRALRNWASGVPHSTLQAKPVCKVSRPACMVWPFGMRVKSPPVRIAACVHGLPGRHSGTPERAQVGRDWTRGCLVIAYMLCHNLACMPCHFAGLAPIAAKP